MEHATAPAQRPLGRPYLMGSLTTAVSRGGARLGEETADLLATDLRLGLSVGWMVGSWWSPYLAGRLFGSPLFLGAPGDWLRGVDRHHYNLALGSSFFLPAGWVVFADGSALGISW